MNMNEQITSLLMSLGCMGLLLLTTGSTASARDCPAGKPEPPPLTRLLIDPQYMPVSGGYAVEEEGAYYPASTNEEYRPLPV